jgi:hypothetical protein
MVQATEDRSEQVSLQNAAYNAAWKRLREKYRDEYDGYLDEEFKSRKLTRRKRSTGEQRTARLNKERVERAAERVKKLLAENPELKDQLPELAAG